MNHFAPLFFAAVGVLFAAPAHAAECWQVTGWATTAPPGWGLPSGALERASLVPVTCDVTPPGYRWLHIDHEFSALNPAPADLYVLAQHEDYTRGDGTELFRGLTWQGRYSGFPILWRAWRQQNLVFELLAPTPIAPAVGARVLLRHRSSGYCVNNGSVGYSEHLYLSYGGPAPTCYNTLNQWSDGTYVIVDAGTNGGGQPLVQLEHLNYETCSYVDDFYGTDMWLHDDCSLGQSGYDLQLVPVSGGGYRLRSEDTGLCYGSEAPGTNSGWMHPASCTSSESIYDIVTLQRASTGGGGGGEVPPEEM